MDVSGKDDAPEDCSDETDWDAQSRVQADKIWAFTSGAEI